MDGTESAVTDRVAGMLTCLVVALKSCCFCYKNKNYDGGIALSSSAGGSVQSLAANPQPFG